VNPCQSQFRSGLETDLGLAYYCTCGLSLRKGMKDLGREVSKRTGTLVDPQTEELAMGYRGLSNRNRM